MHLQSNRPVLRLSSSISVRLCRGKVGGQSAVFVLVARSPAYLLSMAGTLYPLSRSFVRRSRQSRACELSCVMYPYLACDVYL